MSVELPGLNVVDIRQPIVGDSFSWSGMEPTAAKKSLVFHHSGSDVPSEDGFSIADYHVNHNGWSGVGYHIIITRSDYPGRAGFTPPGAQIQYVGDLGTWRAHVANQNPGRVGICFVGMSPDAEQLKLGRQLVDYFISPNNVLPSINYYSQVTVHRLVPEQSTSCPGDNYGDWLPYLQGGDFPAYLNPPQPAPAPIVPPQNTVPEWESTWRPQSQKNTPVVVTSDVIDVTTGASVAQVTQGQVIADIAGFFTYQGKEWARTDWSVAHGKWNGIPSSALGTPEVQQIPVTKIEGDPITAVIDSLNLDKLPAEVKTQIIDKFWAFLKEVVAILLSPIIKKKG